MTREQLQSKFQRGRQNLLMMLVLSGANVLMIALGSPFVFPFSLSATNFIYELGEVFSESGDPGLMAMAYAGIVLILALFFIFYIFSKKQQAMLIPALVLFILDTLLLCVLGILSEALTDASFLVDILFHIWVLFYLWTGVRAGAQLKKLPPEPAEESFEDGAEPEEMGDAEDGSGENPENSAEPEDTEPEDAEPR